MIVQAKIMQPYPRATTFEAGTADASMRDSLRSYVSLKDEGSEESFHLQARRHHDTWQPAAEAVVYYNTFPCS